MVDYGTGHDDRYGTEWATAPDDPADRLCEYIIGPDDLPDSHFDEGEGD